MDAPRAWPGWQAGWLAGSRLAGVDWQVGWLTGYGIRLGGCISNNSAADKRKTAGGKFFLRVSHAAGGGPAVKSVSAG